MIKKIAGSWLMILMLTLQTVSLTAQIKVPKAVKTTFKQIYADAEDLVWEIDEKEYMATFSYDDHYCEATFEENGTWVQTEIFIEYEELPRDARKFIEAKYSEELDYFGITKMESPDFIHFLFNFETELEYINLVFDKNGNLLEKEVEKIDNDDGQ